MVNQVSIQARLFADYLYLFIYLFMVQKRPKEFVVLDGI